MKSIKSIVLLLSAVASTLIESSKTSSTKIRGVNLGGWLLLEPWITPSLFEPYLGQPDAPVDEYTLTKRLGNNAKEFMERHWSTFATKDDFEKLAKAGINSIRIPIGYWAVDIVEGEPWVEGSFDYLLKGIQWAKETKLEVMIDIHGAPGSQNGRDNSGRVGDVHFFEKDHLDRQMKILTNLTSHFTQPQYKDTVTSIQLLNEPNGSISGFETIKDFYQRAINTVREANSDIDIAVHDGYLPLNKWEYLKNDTTLKSRDNLIYDTHLYQLATKEVIYLKKEDHLNYTCKYLEPIEHANSIYPTIVGEWSLASTDCTKYLFGFQQGNMYEGTLDPLLFPLDKVHPLGSCSEFDDLTKFTPEHKEFLKSFFRQQVGVFEASGAGWYFWNFKAENSPEWNFLLGVEQGWINLHEPITHQC